MVCTVSVSLFNYVFHHSASKVERYNVNPAIIRPHATQFHENRIRLACITDCLFVCPVFSGMYNTPSLLYTLTVTANTPCPAPTYATFASFSVRPNAHDVDPVTVPTLVGLPTAGSTSTSEFLLLVAT